MQQLPGQSSVLHSLLGADRAELIIAVGRDALTLLLVVCMLVATTLVITQAAQLFGDVVHILPYINYGHESVVAIGIMVLMGRSIIEMWGFLTKKDD